MCGLLPASARAAFQTQTDPSDAPPGAQGKADLRVVTWDVTATTASVKIAVDESTYGPSGDRAALGVHLLLDTDADGLADAEIVATRNANGVTVDFGLRALDEAGTTTCQFLDGKGTAEIDTVATVVADGLETFTFAFDPTAVPGGLASFRWAGFATAPADPAAGGPWDVMPDAADAGVAAANPSDRRCGPLKQGLPLRMSEGVGFPDGVAPTPTATATPSATPIPTPSPPGGPKAVVTLAGGQPKAGTMATLDARATKPAAGTHIVAYRWDMNGDGRYETNTGPRAIAHLLIGHGARTVGMQAVDNLFHTDATTVPVTAGPVAAGCDPEASVGVLRLTAACIRRDGDDLVATPGPTDQRDGWERPFYAVGLNGAVLMTRDPNARIRIDRLRDEISGNGVWKLMILNGPQGDIEFYESGAGGFDWPLPSQAGRGGGEPAAILSLALDDTCRPAEADGFVTVCARVPGDFPLTGRIDLGVDTDTYELVIDANVTINVAISVTGRVRLRANVLIGGLVLDGIGFALEDAEIGVLTLHHLRFDYEPPGGGTPPHEGDLWDVGLDIEVAKIFEAAGRMIFEDGQFSYLRSDIRFTPGILVYPGVFLNRFGGEVGLNPTRFGGLIGASFASTVLIDANWLAAYLPDRTAAILTEGNLSVLGVPLAHAYSAIWTNGLYTFGGEIGFQYPATEQPRIRLSGGIDFWAEAQRDSSVRFQAATNLTMRLLDMYDERTQVFVNNEWAVGCLGRFVMGTYNWRSREIRALPGCDTAAYSYRPTLDRPALRPPPRGRASAQIAQGPTPTGKAVTVRADERALVLDVNGQGGAPAVTLTDPKGRTYFPTDKPGEVVRDGAFTSVYLPQGGSVLLRVEHPIAGEWIISPLPGSVPIDKVGTAQALPPLKVTARVTGRGRTRVLHWRAPDLAGRTLRFAERGKNSGQTIAVTTKEEGRARYTIDDGSAGVRRVEAQVTIKGRPVGLVKVARYRAPGPAKPRRPGKLRAKRRGGTVTITWPKQKGAGGFVVRIRGSDGRRAVSFPTAKRHRVAVERVGRKTRLAVRVYAWKGNPGIVGRVRTIKVRAG